MLTEIDSVLASPAALPGFWIFMYRISPFTYLIGAFLSTGLANNEVRCASLELATFNPPSGQTCGEYIETFVKMAGGAIYNPTATQDCKYCPMSTTNIFLASVYSFYDERWRNFGLMWVYIVFNAFVAVLLYWLLRVPHKSSLKKGLGGLLQKVFAEKST